MLREFDCAVWLAFTIRTLNGILTHASGHCPSWSDGSCHRERACSRLRRTEMRKALMSSEVAEERGKIRARCTRCVGRNRRELLSLRYECRRRTQKPWLFVLATMSPRVSHNHSGAASGGVVSGQSVTNKPKRQSPQNHECTDTCEVWSYM